MPYMPDVTGPRYLDEIGWFLYHEQYQRDQFGGSYDEERFAYSRSLQDEVLDYCDQDHKWLADKTVISIGCGCTGDLVAWPAAIKIAVDPLLYVYQKLGMLLDDVVGTTRTVHLAVSAEELPLLDECADLVICRNALDHMPAPARVLQQIWRILKPAGGVFLSVDIGGVSTPDEPTVFSADSLAVLLRAQFEIVKQIDNKPAHSGWRPGSVRILARKKPHAGVRLDKEKILRAYMARLGEAE